MWMLVDTCIPKWIKYHTYHTPQITKIVESLNTQMQTKGRELTEYRERYNIRLVGEGEGQGAGQSAAPSSRDSDGGGSKSGTGVLVS